MFVRFYVYVRYLLYACKILKEHFKIYYLNIYETNIPNHNFENNNLIKIHHKS